MNFWNQFKKPIKILAPMEDVTDTVFRRIVAECGRPDVFFTEFTSADGLNSPGREAVIKRLQFTESERPLVAQIWGSNPENYYKAARDIAQMGFDGIDINMGCPVKKIVQHGSCSALILNPPLAKEIILATKEGAGELPVSVKTRLGFNKNVVEEWSNFLLDLEPAVLTMHGRTAKQMSDVPADWDEIRKVVKIRDERKSDTLIIGNGDVSSLNDLNEKAVKHKVDGAMVGRGIFKDVFLFNPDRSVDDLTPEKKMELLLKHTKLYVETWGNTRNFAVMKRFFKIYCRDFEGAVELRGELMKCSTIEQVERVIKDHNFDLASRY